MQNGFQKYDHSKGSNDACALLLGIAHLSGLSPSVVLKMTAGEGANTYVVVIPIVNINAIKIDAVIVLFIHI